jgi:glycosyltransferase involved in cell wall biosynthesis
VLPKGRFWTQRILGAELRRHPPDVFFSPVTQLPRGLGCPAAATVHDLAFLDYGEHFTMRARLLARMQARHAVRSARLLIADSEATRADLVRHYQVASERIRVVYPGCAPRFGAVPAAGEVEALRSKLGLLNPFVLYVGRLQPRKNLPGLISAFEQLCRDHPDLPHDLVIAGGKGWLYESIFAAAMQSPVAKRIRFAGFVSAEDLPVLYAAAEVLALVSLWEGFGFPVIEAMAAGTPVLTSDRSSLPEVAADAAVLVNPEDASAIAAGLHRLITDTALRETLIARGRVRAAAFTWDRSASQLRDALETIGV